MHHFTVANNCSEVNGIKAKYTKLSHNILYSKTLYKWPSYNYYQCECHIWLYKMRNVFYFSSQRSLDSLI